MADVNLLQRLRDEFRDSAPPADQIHGIKARIAEDLRALGEQQRAAIDQGILYEIPARIEGLRKRYLGSLQRNREAKAKLARLQQSQSESTASSPTVAVLTPHVELLLLRDEHRKINIIARDVVQAGQIRNTGRALAITPSYEMNLEGGIDSDRIDQLSARIAELRRSLEVSLLTADHHLRHEQASLLKFSSSTRNNRPASRSRSRALETTRHELTSWIESSLAKCDLQRSEDQASESRGPLRTSEITANQVEEEYQRYCKARIRLAQAASTFEVVLHDVVTNSISVQSGRPPNRPTSSLAAIEMHCLHLWEAKSNLKQHEVFIKDLISAEKQRLNGDLRLLSDESHLLPSYPLLKRTHHRSRSAAQINIEKEGMDPNIDLLRAWKFANDAATISTCETIVKLSTEVEDASQIAEDALENMETSWTMWQSLGIS